MANRINLHLQEGSKGAWRLRGSGIEGKYVVLNM